MLILREKVGKVGGIQYVQNAIYCLKCNKSKVNVVQSQINANL